MSAILGDLWSRSDVSGLHLLRHFVLTVLVISPATKRISKENSMKKHAFIGCIICRSSLVGIRPRRGADRI